MQNLHSARTIRSQTVPPVGVSFFIDLISCFSALSLPCTETTLRLVRGDNDVMLALSNREAAHLMDACAMVVLAAESVPQASLDPELSTLLQDLFTSLQATVPERRQPRPVDPDSGRQ
jgi:hypothetical protein